MRVKDAVGRFGEQLAVDRLQRAGLQVLDRNWRCREGEIDIVARDGSVLVFVEVKTRSSEAFGAPALAVNADKAARIRRLGLRWMMERRAAGVSDDWWSALRFDVVSIIRCTPNGPDVQHIESAF
jgi:putative endonuclease